MIIQLKPGIKRVKGLNLRRSQGRILTFSTKASQLSNLQAKTQNALATASRLYSILPPLWRLQWNIYAQLVPQCCRYGPPHLSTGQRWYVGSLSQRIRWQDTSTIPELPLSAARTDPEIVETVYSPERNEILTSHFGAAEWYGDPNGRLFLYVTSPFPSQRSPRYLRQRPLLSATPAAFPAFTVVAVPYPFFLPPGYSALVYWRTATSDNRYSVITANLLEST